MPETTLEDTVYEDAVSYSLPYNRYYPQIDPSISKKPTILQRLPTNTVSEFHIAPLQLQRQQQQLQQQQQQTPPLPTNTTSILGDASFRILQTKLSLKRQNKEKQDEINRIKKLDRPMYYKPPSSNFRDNSLYGIKDCLPPNVTLIDQQSAYDTKQPINKIPIFVNYQETKPDATKILQSIKDEFDEVDLDNQVIDNPTGSWENPIVKEALSRQVDLEYQVKLLLRNLIYLLLFTFFKSSINKLAFLYELKSKIVQPVYQHQPPKDSSVEFYLLVFSKVVVVYFIINIVIPLVKLLKGQDQCNDLPLSIKQRKLIGLKVKDVPEDFTVDEAAELTLKQRRYDLKNENKFTPIPKYNKLNDYSVFNVDGRRTESTSPELVSNQSLYHVRKDPSDLTNEEPIGLKFLAEQNSQNSTRKYSTETIQKVQSKFEKNFDIKF
ncbi:hypothetical protein SBY92_001602 [Candida maltosa Xu316]